MPAPQKLPTGGCDALSGHLRAIGRVPLLTPEQEITLARQIQEGIRLREVAQEMAMRSGGPDPCEDAWALEAGLTAARLRRRLQQAERARSRMVVANLRLVVSVARRYRHSGLPLDDLIQEGTIGLIRAVERFDPTRGYRFSTYATWWIREGIGRGINERSRTIRLPASLADTLARVRRAQQSLGHSLGRPPGLEELAAATGLRPLDIREALFRSQEPLSLDAAPVSHSGLRLVETIACPAQAPEALVLDDQRRQDLLQVLQDLAPPEAELLRLRFGLHGQEPLSLSAAARAMGVTRDTARGIERRATAAVRRLSDRVIDYVAD
ncbi:MAG: sigma-70 family RNA polymerase sigma factor [Synechococcaceae cyanobacterium]